MKKIFTLIALMTCGIAAMAQGLAASLFQAELRDASGELIANTTVGFKYKISCIGAENAVIEREGTALTNANGVVEIRLGMDGTATANNKVANFGDFPFDKVAHNYKIPMTMEIDPKGGKDYTISGTTQIGFAVPYAVYAKNAESAQSFGDLKLTTISKIADDYKYLTYTICGKSREEIATSGLTVPVYSTVNMKVDYPTTKGDYYVFVNGVLQGELNYKVEVVKNVIIDWEWDDEKEESIPVYGTRYDDKYTCSGNIQNDTKNKVFYIPVVINGETPTISIGYQAPPVY